MVIGSLVTNIVADLSKWGPNLTKARGQLGSFVKSVNVLKASIAGVVAVSGAAWIKQLAGQASALKDQAANLNLTIESMQRLRFASTQLGGNWKSLGKSIVFYNDLVGDAARGSKAAQATLASLGLEAKQLASIGTQPGFLKAIDAIRMLPLSQQTSAARALFGRGGADNLGFFNNGSSAIQGQMAGLMSLEVVSAETARRLDELADKAERLQLAWESIKLNTGGFLVDMWDRMTGGAPTQRPTLSNWFGMTSDPSANRSPLPAIFPARGPLGNPMSVRQPMTPAMTGNRPSIMGPAPPIVQWQASRDASRGMLQAQNAFSGVLNMLPNRIALAIRNATGTAPSLGPFGDWARNAGGALASLSNMGARPTPDMPHRSLSFTRAGTAESYRQRAAIGQQNEQAKTSKNHLKEAQKQTGIFNQLLGAFTNGAAEPAGIF